MIAVPLDKLTANVTRSAGDWRARLSVRQVIRRAPLTTLQSLFAINNQSNIQNRPDKRIVNGYPERMIDLEIDMRGISPDLIEGEPTRRRQLNARTVESLVRREARDQVPMSTKCIASNATLSGYGCVPTHVPAWIAKRLLDSITAKARVEDPSERSEGQHHVA
jgi:hypothetical protein